MVRRQNEGRKSPKTVMFNNATEQSIRCDDDRGGGNRSSQERLVVGSALLGRLSSKNLNNTDSETNSVSLTDESGSTSTNSSRRKFKLGSEGSVFDENGRNVGRIESSPVFSIAFWKSVHNGLFNFSESALFQYARPRELHVALANSAELFAITSSILAGFSISLFEIANLGGMGIQWYFPIQLSITIAFLCSIASVVSSVLMFIGVSTTPSVYIHLFAKQMGRWILRPAQLLGASYVLLAAAYATVIGMAKSALARWLIIGLIISSVILVLLSCLVLFERMLAVRDFVAEDERKTQERKKEKKQMKKLAKVKKSYLKTSDIENEIADTSEY
eukprot:CAMPEP_0182444922 /NCGR_PEP_ID=MMETSP1172-20130603/3212_1 /TAXON_ID=708627 /ORGANISM="Timspurckia oligopyrenoides, Strain CCMP3278" /LENGTH=331 /DNA_ID=CAMNT_0024640585 /DNA_START=71 /DNA_END=1066 /DNA_ORIENTATION=+